MNVKTKGFTLIELLVVISIIGLLASVVFTQLTEVRAAARDTKRYQELIQVQTALEAYWNDHGSYPTTGGLWFTVCTDKSDPTERDTAGPNGYIPNLAPRYITELPVDPTGCIGGAFGGYIYASNGVDYKFATDWQGETGSACGPGARFWDPARGVGGYFDLPRLDTSFCSVYTPGALTY